MWDARTGELMVARDRFGIKPLFIAEGGGRMAFASEIKSLLHLPWVDRAWLPEALRAYLQVGYVPCPLTAYRGVRKMEPGTAELWRLDGSRARRRTRHDVALLAAGPHHLQARAVVRGRSGAGHRAPRGEHPPAPAE